MLDPVVVCKTVAGYVRGSVGCSQTGIHDEAERG